MCKSLRAMQVWALNNGAVELRCELGAVRAQLAALQVENKELHEKVKGHCSCITTKTLKQARDVGGKSG